MNYHIRFTPCDISGYTFEWLNAYSRYVVAYECHSKSNGEPAEPHYHIYIQDVGECESSLRNAVKANFKIPKSGRGKNNKYYQLEKEWKDPDYVFKFGDIRHSKGFSEKEVLDRVVSGKKKYIDKVKSSVQGDTIIYEVTSKKVKRIDLNKELMADLLTFYMLESRTRDVSVKELISKCCDLILAHGRGINNYQVRDFVNAVLFQKEESRQIVVDKIYSLIV